MLVDPGQGRKPPSVTAESNPGKEMSTARPSSRKFEHIGIVAVVGAFASVGLVCFVLAMPHPIEPSLGDRTAQPSGDRANSTSATAAEDAIRSKPVTPPLTETAPTLAVPMLYQLPTSLSDAQLAASLHAPPKLLRDWIENPRHRSGHRGDTGRGILYALKPIAEKPLG